MVLVLGGVCVYGMVWCVGRKELAAEVAKCRVLDAQCTGGRVCNWPRVAGLE